MLRRTCGEPGRVRHSASSRVCLLAGCLLVSGAALAACGGDDAVVQSDVSAASSAPAEIASETSLGGSVAPPRDLEGTWRAIEGVVGGEPVELVPTAPITIEIDGDRISGTAACNDYFFRLEELNGVIEISEGTIQDIGCDASLVALEHVFLTSFGPTASYEFVGSDLIWTSPTAVWVFERVPEIPDPPLVGTMWVLNSIMDDMGGMSAEGIDSGWIVFAPDGTVTGSTSCRDFTARWEPDVARTRVFDVVLDGECDGPMAAVDTAVAEVLNAGFEGVITKNQLVAQPTDVLGLRFVAAL